MTVRSVPGSANARVRVVVADDHPLYREGVVRALKERPDLELVCECDDGREALEEIRRLDPDARVAMVTANVDQQAVMEAVKAGARDFVVKPPEPDRLLATVDGLLARG